MKHFLLKFNHGVEIGATLAYQGHFKRTGDLKVFHICTDEIQHRMNIESILKILGETSNRYIDLFFSIIGNIIKHLCLISPEFLLNYVAMSLEIFAVYSYRKLAIKYSEFQYILLDMAETEEEHKFYFTKA